MNVPLDKIRPSPHPIRSSWDEDKMVELAQSVKEQGIIVPIKVRPTTNAHYEIVYGHRRVEAARRAGLSEIPAFSEGVDDTDALIQALIENVQREDMSVEDKAIAVRTIKDMTGWSNRELERHGIVSNETASQWLRWFSEYEAGAAVRVDTQLGPGDEGVMKTLEIRRALGDDIEVKRQVAKKASKENLNREQTRQVAESVAAAGSEKRRQYLIDHPYSPYTHDPAYQREREQQYGDHDVLLQDAPERPADEGWIGLPSVKEAIDTIKWWHETLKDMRKMASLGKMAPEAKRFIAHRLESFAEDLETLIFEFGE